MHLPHRTLACLGTGVLGRGGGRGRSGSLRRLRILFLALLRSTFLMALCSSASLTGSGRWTLSIVSLVRIPILLWFVGLFRQNKTWQLWFRGIY